MRSSTLAEGLEAKAQNAMFRVKSPVLAVGQPLPVYPKGLSASNVPTGNMTNLLDRLAPLAAVELFGPTFGN